MSEEIEPMNVILPFWNHHSSSPQCSEHLIEVARIFLQSFFLVDLSREVNFVAYNIAI